MKPELKIALDNVATAKRFLGVAQSELDRCKDELLQFAPVKVGDIIPVMGYTYKGKNMLVKRVIVKESGFRGETELTFKATGHVIKKDGHPSDAMVGECEWYMDGRVTR